MKRGTISLHTAAGIVTGLLIAAIPVRAPAEDIELFLGNTNNTAQAPNIVIVFDNASSNNASMTNPCGATQKKMEMEQCTLAALINSSAVTSGVNIGLAAYTPSGGGSVNGGYILSAVRSMTAANKTTLVTSINSLLDNAHNSNNAPYALSLYETYLYYASGTPYAGLAGATGSVYDTAAVAGGKYVSPATDSCQKNYIIFIGNGTPDSNEDGTAKGFLSAAPLNGVKATDPISLSPNNFQSNWSDELTRTLYQSKLTSSSTNIITYTIAVHNPADSNDKTAPQRAGRALLKSMALNGGGKYFDAKDQASLQKALEDILIEITSANSVFASVTLPVSVNVRGTYLDQVYMGVFRPDINALPRWVGNLKEYRVTVDTATSSVYMVDANGAAITNNATGFVSANAVSFWTAPSTFWTFAPSGAGLGSDSPDGDIVEKGAEAQWLRNTYASSQTARKVYTCNGSCANGSLLSATPFNTTNTNITQAAIGAATAQERDDLINWARGTDMNDENNDGLATDVRASIHGDVLHSRPAVINYNRDGTDNDVFVFYGANDGFLHAIKGGRATDGGTEQWSFIPPEFFGNLKRIRDNNVNIVSPNPDKPFFFDGPVGIYQNDVNGDGKLTSADVVQITAGMRRGGRLLYSFDVTDPTTPKLKWKAASTTNGYAELGQTWSLPVSAKIHATSNPVIIMGAGYDPVGEDPLPRGVDTKGRGILVIDANSGNVLWQAGPSPSGAATNVTVAGMIYSFPSDPLVVDRDFDGFADRIYAVDAGANIWRVDMDDTSPANWTVTKIAALGGIGGNDRKFLYPPDVVFSDASHPFDSILVGTGDREHPFDKSISNRFYMIKDPNTGKSINAGFTTIIESDLYDATADLVQSTDPTISGAAQSALDAAKGWYIVLGTGEKVVGSTVVIGGVAYFATHQPTDPAPGVCNNLGTARAYMVKYLDGGAVTGTTVGNRVLLIPGGGFPPSPVAIVTLENGKLGQGVCFGPNCFNGKPPKLGARHKMYWHNDRDQ